MQDFSQRKDLCAIIHKGILRCEKNAQIKNNLIIKKKMEKFYFEITSEILIIKESLLDFFKNI